MDITNCSKEELAQAVLELTIELGKIRRALNAALELTKEKEKVKVKIDGNEREISMGDAWKMVMWKSQFEAKPTLTSATIDPLATDPRHIV